jgi:hypothetical protein
MPKRVRLVTVQGPSQLLSVLAVLDREDGERPGLEHDDYLIVHGLFTSRDRDIVLAVEDLSRVRNWKAVINLTSLEPEIVAGVDVSERIQEQIGVHTADSVYSCRNWQPTNEAILRSYAGAEKVLYGDGLGVADSYYWPGFAKFDRAALCLPIEAEFGLLDRIPMSVVPRRHLHSVIGSYIAISSHVPEYVREVNEWMHEDGLLVLATNGTESGWIADLETEASLYVEHVLRYVRSGQRVVLKQHPRECHGQSELTRRLLEERGIRTRVIGGLMGAMPIEILCRELRVKEVLAMISISAVNLKYLYDLDCRIGDSDLLLPRLRPQPGVDYARGQQELAELIAKLASWDGTGILSRSGPPVPAHRARLTNAIDLLVAGRHSEALQRFDELLADGCTVPQVSYGRAASLLGQDRTVRGALALRRLRGTPYGLPATRLLEGRPGMRRLLDLLRPVRERLRTGGGFLRRKPIGGEVGKRADLAPPVVRAERPATATLGR